MEDSVDVKALRDRFYMKADMADAKGSDAQRPPLQKFTRTGPPMAPIPPTNGAPRPKLPSPAPTPLPRPRTSPDLCRLPQLPVADLESAIGVHAAPPPGLFPRPPPSHRTVPALQAGKVKAAGELLQNMMLKQPSAQDGAAAKPAPSPAPSPVTPLRSQRSMAEVPPLRRTLPPEGPRPVKPKRPPTVNLDVYRRVAQAPPVHRLPAFANTSGANSPSTPSTASPTCPPKLPRKPSSLNQQRSIVHEQVDQETYDDIDVLPPPPPPPPGRSAPAECWRAGSTQGDEESDEEIYEPVDEEEKTPEQVSPGKKMLKEMRREQKEKQKKENEYKKKFKLTGHVEVLHVARVSQDWRGGKNDLCVRQGDRVEIIRVKNNPGGMWLARTTTGTYGYISNICVEVDYEEVKRSLHFKPNDSSFLPPPPAENDDFYYDVGSPHHNDSSTNLDDDVYDDVDPSPMSAQMSEDFPLPPPEVNLDLKKSKKQEKEEKEFRKKFKFEGPINVLCNMMVDPGANIKKGGGKDLPLAPGEILDVIQLVNDKKALCRNAKGKYGYVPRVLLLQEEGDIYDDIDNNADVYDNDSRNT